MSLQEAAAAGTAAHSHEETVTGTGHAHPSDRSYVGIAMILALITAAEVATFYLEDSLGGILMLLSLVGMSLAGKLPGERGEMSVEMVGLYWHFVDIVWIVIFTVVYLIR